MPVQAAAPQGGTWHERGVALRATAGFVGRPADRPAAAGGDRRRARLPDRDPSAGPGLHAHAGRPAGGRARRSSSTTAFRRRVLPPAAPHGHADVPSRPPGRPDPLAGRRAKRTSPRTSTSPASRWRRRRRAAVLGYTTQARFLINCGLLSICWRRAWPRPAGERTAAQRLVAEHEMGELFKVIGFRWALKSSGSTSRNRSTPKTLPASTRPTWTTMCSSFVTRKSRRASSRFQPPVRAAADPCAQAVPAGGPSGNFDRLQHQGGRRADRPGRRRSLLAF
jgi:hypothetical protein